MKYIFFDKIDSTNTYILDNYKNLDDETIIIANKQEKGKGRNNRKWFSPLISEKNSIINNLYFSIYLKLNLLEINILNIKNLAHYSAIILCRILKKYNCSAFIKWPNDIIVFGKKLSGILCESIIHGNEINLVIGIGVNLNMSEEFFKEIDNPAISLNILCKRDINRNEFLDLFCKEFFDNLRDFLKLGFKSIKDEYIGLSFLKKNDLIKVKIFDKFVEGIYKYIDDDGQIILDADNGENIINIGDVFIKK